MRVGRQLTTYPHPYIPTPHPQPVEATFCEAAAIRHDPPLRPPLPPASDPLIDGLLTTCCSFSGYMAVRELLAHGTRALAARMFHGEAMSVAEARAFAPEFEDAIAKLVAKRPGPATRSEGARWELVWDPEFKKWVHGFRPGFEESIDILRATARWYAYVGRRGFGVEAWW